MLPLDRALERVLATVPPARPERIPLADADGRVLSEPLRSAIDLPPFDNSAMDGYAVRAEELAGPGAGSPVRLRLAGRIPAGHAPEAELPKGACVRLFTGSPIPPCANAVVMQEHTITDPNRPDEVHILAAVEPGENVRLRGEDLKAGEVLCEAGHRLNPVRLSLLAAAGLAEVQVGRRPVVGVLATGSELKSAGETLKPGQIYESNRVGLAALIRRAGGLPQTYPAVPDAPGATRDALNLALEQCDLVVTSGGVSVGEMDFIKRAFEDCGGELQFWRVDIKPGRPFAFGRRGHKLLFGLPGNPVSALVTFALLVRPAILRWQGASEVALPLCPGVAGETLANAGARPHFLRVRIDSSGQVFSAGTQASHVLSSLASANGLLEVQPHATLKVGASVQVLRWD